MRMRTRILGGVLALSVFFSGIPTVAAYPNNTGISGYTEGDSSAVINEAVSPYLQGLSGRGTQEDPYLISDREDLESLADAVNNNNDLKGLYFEQTGDIDLEGDPWPVIGHVIGNTPHPFNGVYDGGNYNIYGLYVYSRNEDAGLFGHVGEDGIIRKVHVVDCDLYNSALYVGGIAGRNEGLVEYCSSVASSPEDSTGVIRGGWQYAGGVVGYNFGKISYCYSNCDVYG
ncbi:MAG: hypothetical protein J1E39_05330, partial [Eubacterium sp.]|nr:hypothetical protein [Eubacterium sp.]